MFPILHSFLNVTFVPTFLFLFFFLFKILSIYLRSWNGIKIAVFVSYGHTTIKNDWVQSSLRYGTLDMAIWMKQNFCVNPVANKSSQDAHFSCSDWLFLCNQPDPIALYNVLSKMHCFYSEEHCTCLLVFAHALFPPKFCDLFRKFNTHREQFSSQIEIRQSTKTNNYA